MHRKVIMWFRSDLRLHDNEALTEAIKYGDEVLLLYVFDDRVFKSKTPYGFKKTGISRARFIIESVSDLRNSIRSLGSELIVRSGKPEEIIYELARKYKTQFVFCNRERTHEEVLVQDKVEHNLWTIGQELRFSRGKMLYYTQDLPFPVTHTPDTFTQFRKEVEKIVPVRIPYPVPEYLKPTDILIDPGNIPDIETLIGEPAQDTPQPFFFKGGEQTGLQRIKEYLWQDNQISLYQEPVCGLLNNNLSSRLSPWLSHGCISPKMLYRELKRYEAEKQISDKTGMLIQELEMRDFLRLMAKKYGNAIFRKNGIAAGSITNNKPNKDQLLRWLEGTTDQPFVNAAIKELKNTGYLNRICRYAAAAYFVNEIKADWRIGASFFESNLLDYDPASNWLNWNYIAGVGPDNKEFRHVSIAHLISKYDPKGEYQSFWS